MVIMGELHFGGVEVFRPILEFERLLSGDLINKPYLSQDDIISEARKSKRKKHTHGHIIFILPAKGGN